MKDGYDLYVWLLVTGIKYNGFDLTTFLYSHNNLYIDIECGLIEQT